VRALSRHEAWSFVSYEAMVLEPDAVVQGTAATLDLDHVERMRKRIAGASRSVRRLSANDRKSAIQAGDRQALLSSWRRRIDVRDEARAFRLIEAFGVTLYEPGRDAPTELYRFPASEPLAVSSERGVHPA
jgi:hypothetical protein